MEVILIPYARDLTLNSIQYHILQISTSKHTSILFLKICTRYKRPETIRTGDARSGALQEDGKTVARSSLL
jgi:hypothetical protein